MKQIENKSNQIKISKNQEYELVIEDMTQNGEGVGRIDGYALFVKDTVIGDRTRAKVTKANKNYGYGRMTALLEPSADRVEPPCPSASACGGCTLMAMSYEKQLEFKRELIRSKLTRIGGLTDIEIPPVIGMDNPYRYRNKAQFPVGTDRSGNIVMGFYAGRTHFIIPCDDCLIGDSVNSAILAQIKSHMLKYHIRPYDEGSHTGLLRHILIRVGFATGEVMVCLVINGDTVPGKGELISSLQSMVLPDNRKIASVMLNINRERTNVILGTECRLLWGEPFIEDRIGGIRYRISPLSFYQVNPAQTKILYELTLEYAGLTGRETVWDLYCGIGTISLFLAQRARRVYGVEIIPQAVEDARRNAALNGIGNAEFFAGKAEEILPDFYAKETERTGQPASADVIVVDPPRKGCAETLLATIVKMAPSRVVYVSCDPATLARDLKYLTDGGYEVKRVQGVDQFGMTGHVETVVMLSNKKPDSVINVKVEFGEGEGKVPLDNIAKRVAAYKPKG